MWSDRDEMSSVDEIDLMKLGRRSVAGMVDMVLSYVESCWTIARNAVVCMISVINFAPLLFLCLRADDGQTPSESEVRSSLSHSSISCLLLKARRST